MLIGLFVDMRNPPPWRRPYGELYGRMLEHLQDADRLGLGSVWLTEHHLFEDGYLPQPLTLAAAIAVRTRHLRIGTAVLQAPIRPAIDIAEQAAIVDILSGGRLELGLGAGYRIPEWQAFGVDGSRRFELLEDRVREIRRLWESGEATPTPIQPELPIWIGSESPRGARLAGRLGEGLLVLNEDLLAIYRRQLAESGHDANAARVSGCANLLLVDDPEQAWPIVAPHLRYQWQSYENYAVEGYDRTPREVDPERLRTSGTPILPRFDVVTPEEAAARLLPWLSPLPVAHVYFWASIAGLTDALVSRHIELLATKLTPLLEPLGLR